MSKPNDLFRMFEEQQRKKGVIVTKTEIPLPKPGKLTVGNLYRDPYSEKVSQ